MTGKSVITTWFMSLGKLMFDNRICHRLVAGRMHQPANGICFEILGMFTLHIIHCLLFFDFAFQPMGEIRVATCGI